MTDNVISLGTRKPFSEEIEAKAATASAAAAELAEEAAMAKAATLETLDRIREMVAADRCAGLVILTQELGSNLFCSDVILNRDVTPPAQFFGWAGHLGCLAAEITQLATMAPVLMIDGTVSDPYEEMTAEGLL